MSLNISVASYLVASVLFILSLGGLSTQETARRGNLFGIAGILLAILATALNPAMNGYAMLAVALSIGVVIGAVLAARVAMTSMPELVAILHSFVGLAAVLVGIANAMTFVGAVGEGHGSAETLIHHVEVILGIFIGAVTFTGSLIAFAKLKGSISGKPLMLPGRHGLNIVICLAAIGFGWGYVQSGTASDISWLIGIAILAGVLGVHMVMAIGGADMPVVVSMLNSYSGWAAAATGFLLANDLLIVTGALVGSSGAILSYIMCRAMNRSFFSVIMGGFGTDGGTSPAAGAATKSQGEVTSMTAEETAELLKESRSVVIIPGYGMAVAHAQHPIREITDILRKKGVNVRFAIHPVAGRLPGHMNVLLAEANLPYDIVLEMDEINDDLPETDVVIVVGANDIVNPSAQTDAASPIFGMPVLEAWKAKVCIVLKRGMASGYAGVDNPLFYEPNTRMLFGDAKKSIDAVLKALM